MSFETRWGRLVINAIRFNRLELLRLGTAQGDSASRSRDSPRLPDRCLRTETTRKAPAPGPRLAAGHFSGTMTTVVPFRPFVRRHELRFSLERLLYECVAAWSGGRPLPEGLADFVVAELDRRGLRFFTSEDDEALFHRGKSRADYRRCIHAALERWNREVSKPRTAEDVANYYRPCGE